MSISHANQILTFYSVRMNFVSSR